MNEYVGPLLSSFLTLFNGTCVRYYPLWDKTRVSLKTLLGIYALVFLLQCVTFVYFREIFAADFSGNKLFKLVTGLLYMLIPFFLIRKSFFQNLFLISVNANYLLIITGTGEYIEHAYGGAFADKYPFLIADVIMILLTALLLPVTLRALKRLFRLLPGGGTWLWRFIWIIPTLFFVLCMMGSHTFLKDQIISPIFVPARVLAGAGLVVTCFMLTRTLRQEAKNAELTEKARMTESLLAIQRQEYGRIAQNVEQMRLARHDMRHQLAVIKGCLNTEDWQGALKYCEEIAASIPVNSEKILCDNFAVNAVTHHYLAIASRAGITADILLDIPAKAGGISDLDLCVIIGNLLENAVEACRRLERGEKFVRVRSAVEGDYLSIVVENSFDGLWHEQNGIYFSRKSGGEPLREGVGLSSVKAVCAKYDGLAKFEAKGNVWRSSALVDMAQSDIKEVKINQERR